MILVASKPSSLRRRSVQRLELVAIDLAVERRPDVLELTPVLHERVFDPSELGVHLPLEGVDPRGEQGLDGVECFYPTHGREQTELLTDHCERLGLLRTGSSDFHGPHHREFSRFRAFSTYGREPWLGPIGTSG